MLQKVKGSGHSPHTKQKGILAIMGTGISRRNQLLHSGRQGGPGLITEGAGHRRCLINLSALKKPETPIATIEAAGTVPAGTELALKIEKEPHAILVKKKTQKKPLIPVMICSACNAGAIATTC